MKKRSIVASVLMLCLILGGCGQTGGSVPVDPESSADTREVEQSVPETENTTSEETAVTQETGTEKMEEAFREPLMLPLNGSAWTILI